MLYPSHLRYFVSWTTKCRNNRLTPKGGGVSIDPRGAERRTFDNNLRSRLGVLARQIFFEFGEGQTVQNAALWTDAEISAIKGQPPIVRRRQF